MKNRLVRLDEILIMSEQKIINLEFYQMMIMNLKMSTKNKSMKIQRKLIGPE